MDKKIVKQLLRNYVDNLEKKLPRIPKEEVCNIWLCENEIRKCKEQINCL